MNSGRVSSTTNFSSHCSQNKKEHRPAEFFIGSSLSHRDFFRRSASKIYRKVELSSQCANHRSGI